MENQTQSSSNVNQGQILDFIRHVYSLGYAKGIMENIQQWEEATKNVFNNYCDSIAEFYKKLADENNIPIKNVFYKCNHNLRELDMLAIVDEIKFEDIFPLLNKHNIDFRNILGSKLKVNINIRCLSEAKNDSDFISIDYPSQVQLNANPGTARQAS